jgi:hypothetical protein
MTSPANSKASRLASIALLLALIAGAAIPVDLVLHARSVTGAMGFPLDDAWIHLTYARTLAEHGQFSYFPGDPATSGSTSPLFTLIEAALFRLVHDEKRLALGLSVLGHAAFLVLFAAWARRRLGSASWAAAAVLLVAFDHRLAILAASGMETSFFLLAMALAFWARLSGRTTLMGVALGLAVWLRPDGLLLAAVFAIDAFLPRGETAGRKRKEAAPRPGTSTRPWIVFGAFVAAWVVFNWSTGHTLLPNTFAAKTAFYRGATRGTFLTQDVLPAFLTTGWIPLLPVLLFAIGREAVRLFRGRPGEARLEVLWTLALVLAYFLFLPYGHRFQRYLMPAVPAAAIASLVALRAVLHHPRLSGFARPLRRPGSALGATLASLAVLAMAAFAIPTTAGEYADIVRYHQARHERTGRWLAEHTPPTAVVATHDIGAIGFYSHRRVIDTVGLITPEVVKTLGTPNYPNMLELLFERRGVTHIAAFEDWLPVDNVAPLFETEAQGEVMRVFPWHTGRTHVVKGRAWSEAAAASAAIQRGDNDLAIQALGRGLGADNRSSQMWFMLGIALGNVERNEDAERAFRRALVLYPDWQDAREALLETLVRQDKPITQADLGVPTPADTAASDSIRRR